jgi:amino acid transporter
MSKHEKLTFWQATVITFNVMFGTGIYINTVNLSKIAGFFGFVSYIFVALILLPLIFSIAALLKIYPSGGFYTYAAKELSPFFGFISSWSYFISKIASASVLIHVFTLLIQTIILPFQGINSFILDFILIALFVWINHYGLKTSVHINYLFVVLKLTPMVFAILSGLYLFHHWSIPSETLLLHGIPATIPLVLFAFIGFEAACSISSEIEDAEKNAAPVVLYAFGFSIITTILYQFLIFLSIGPELMKQLTFLEVFPTLFSALFAKPSHATIHLLNILHIAGASSALGGAYSIIFSNSWNLYMLAKNKHIFFAKQLSKQNQFDIPFACVIVEGVMCALYLIVTQAHQIILQQMSVIGCTVAYLLSIISLIWLQQKKQNHSINPLIPVLAFCSCLLLLGTSVRNALLWGANQFILYGVLLALGIVMYSYINYANKQKISSQ